MTCHESCIGSVCLHPCALIGATTPALVAAPPETVFATVASRQSHITHTTICPKINSTTSSNIWSILCFVQNYVQPTSDKSTYKHTPELVCWIRIRILKTNQKTDPRGKIKASFPTLYNCRACNRIPSESRSASNPPWIRIRIQIRIGTHPDLRLYVGNRCNEQLSVWTKLNIMVLLGITLKYHNKHTECSIICVSAYEHSRL